MLMDFAGRLGRKIDIKKEMPAASIQPEILRAKIKSYLDNMKASCQEWGWTNADISDAQFAIAALIDEVILVSSWAYKDEWGDKSLCQELFGVTHAGEAFYEKLDMLKQAGEKKLPVLEVYYYCLGLGFEGKYSAIGLKKRDSLIEMLAEKFSNPPIKLSPHVTPKSEVLQTDKSRLYQIVAAVFIVLILLVFAISWFKRSQKENEVVQQLSSLPVQESPHRSFAFSGREQKKAEFNSTSLAYF